MWKHNNASSLVKSNKVAWVGMQFADHLRLSQYSRLLVEVSITFPTHVYSFDAGIVDTIYMALSSEEQNIHEYKTIIRTETQNERLIPQITHEYLTDHCLRG